MSLDFLPLIVTVAILTYLTRIGGLVLHNRRPSLFVERVLDYIPIAAFTALIIPGLTDSGPDLTARLLAGIVAIVLAVTTGRLWLVVAGGLGIFMLATRGILS